MSQVETKEASTDVEELGKLITLPARPVSAVWRRQVLGNPNSSIPGPTDWYLEALLEFDEEDARRLTDEAKKEERPRDLGSIASLDWLPAELRENFQRDPNTSKYTVKGEVYSASAFAKPPLSPGYLVRLEDSPRFFLRLNTQ